MASVKTFKLEQDTVERLQAITNELGMSWDATFSALSSMYEQNKMAVEQGRTKEVQQFQTLLQQVADTYLGSLEINGQAEQRIRVEYAARIESAEQSVASLKEAAEKAKQAQTKAEDAYIALAKEHDQQTEELKNAQNALVAAKTSAEKQAAKDAESIAETKKFNEVLQGQVADLQAKLDAMKAEVEAAVALEEEAKTAKQQAQEIAAEKAGLQAQIDALNKQLADEKERAEKQAAALNQQIEDEKQHAKDQIAELTGRFKERADNAEQAAKNRLDAAVLAEREQCTKKAQERIDKMQASLDKATEQRDAWQAKFYELKEQKEQHPASEN